MERIKTRITLGWFKFIAKRVSGLKEMEIDLNFGVIKSSCINIQKTPIISLLELSRSGHSSLLDRRHPS